MSLWLVQEPVQLGVCPGLTFSIRFQRTRITKTIDAGDWAVDDVVETRTNLVLATFLEVVTGNALLADLLTLCQVSSRKQSSYR